MLKIRSLIIIIMANLSLVSCSTYPSKFKCGDAKGLGCTMLSEVDRQIDNGQIEEAYLEGRQNCSGGRCKRLEKSQAMPKVKQSNITKIYLQENGLERPQYQDGNYLYIKE